MAKSLLDILVDFLTVCQLRASPFLFASQPGNYKLIMELRGQVLWRAVVLEAKQKSFTSRELSITSTASQFDKLGVSYTSPFKASVSLLKLFLLSLYSFVRQLDKTPLLVKVWETQSHIYLFCDFYS